MSVRNPHAKSLVMITSLFFFFGFLTCMNDVLVPHLKDAFTLSWWQASLVQFAFFSAYFIASIPSSKFCERVGYQTGMWVGLLVTALGALGLMGAAYTVTYGFFLASLLVLATGITLIQVAANPYVTLLGRPETASSRLTIVQAFNSLGTTAAPLVGSAFILSSDAVDAVRAPYLILALALVGLAVFIFSVKLPKFSAGSESDVPWGELLRNRRLMMGAAAIFTYVGAEVAIGSFLVGWLGDEFVAGLNAETAANYVALYWGGAMVGRFLGTPLLAKFDPARVLQYFVSGAIVLVIASILTGGSAAQWTILAVGLCNSIMFPTIFSISIQGLTRGTEKASGILCTSIVGGAIIPLFQGIAADAVSLRWSFVLPVLCYGYLWVFAAALKERSTVALGQPATVEVPVNS